MFPDIDMSDLELDLIPSDQFPWWRREQLPPDRYDDEAPVLDEAFEPDERDWADWCEISRGE